MRLLIALVAVALLVVGGAIALDSAATSAGDTTVITNESFTPTASGVVVLNDSNLNDTVYANEVHVLDENDTVMTAGQDYEWIDRNGTLNVTAGGDLDGDSTANITYNYTELSETQAGLTEVGTSQLEIMRLFPLVLGAALILVALGVFT